MIELDADQKTPLYEQLYAALADEIRTGQRAPGTPLPGRRTMAAQQGVSVNTVDAAYQMLAAEGLAEPRPRSGFYVQKTYGIHDSHALASACATFSTSSSFRAEYPATTVSARQSSGRAR